MTALATVPLTIRYLGAERYGLWMTIASFEALLILANFGMGHGLLNVISAAHGAGDYEKARRSIASTFYLLSGVVIVIGVVFALLYPSIAWARVFNVASPQAQLEAGPAIAVFVLCWLIDIPIAIIQQIQLGYQQGFTNSLWQILASGLSLLGVFAGAALQVELPWLVLALAGPPVITHLAQFAVFFAFQAPHLRPHWHYVSLEAGRYLMRLGFLYFILQLVQVLAMASDNIIAAQLLGPESVAPLSVAARLFNLPLAFVGMLFTPLWPAYSEAMVRGDVRWVGQTLRNSLRLAVVAAGIPALTLMVFGRSLIQWWAGLEVLPTQLLLVGLGLWTMLLSIGSALAMFLNGANIVKPQVICALLFAVIALLSKVVSAQWFDLPGIVWAGVLSYAIVVVLPYAFLIPKFLLQLSARQETK